MKSLNIAIIGLGCVGQGTLQILSQQLNGNAINIKHLVAKSPNKKRNIAHPIGYNWQTAVYDPEVDVIVELIDDYREAYRIVKAALREAKHVVSANKRMLAEHLGELSEMAQAHGVKLRYDAAVAGSIPVIRNLESSFLLDQVHQIKGILNGSSNYILTLIAEGVSPQDAIDEARQKGFLETEEWLDLNGWDASYKLALTWYHATGELISPSQIVKQGITSIAATDVDWVKSLHGKLKLIASISKHNGKLIAKVLPTVVESGDFSFYVDNEYNAVQVSLVNAGEQTLTGKGAGALPTGSAVVADLFSLQDIDKKINKPKLETIDRVFQEEKEWYYIRLPYTHFSTLLDEYDDISLIRSGRQECVVLANLTIEQLREITERLADNSTGIIIQVPDSCAEKIQTRKITVWETA